MIKCKITVLKTMINEDLTKEYCATEFTPCSKFKEGQEFIAGFEKPENFCTWAWCDIFQYVKVFLSDGNFAEKNFQGWMKDKNIMIACCSDGLRPVVFKIEKIEE